MTMGITTLVDGNKRRIWPRWHCPVHNCPLDDAMRCSRGEHQIEVRNGIPRFTSSSYAEHFGEQWLRYRLTQLDSYTGLPITRERLDRCIGNITVKHAHVLECGCGAGRFTEVLLDKGALVTSVDLSTAVDANAASCPLSDQHRIAQADIMALPFAPQQFDVVLCLGVVQHTPVPEQTLARLFEHVRPGGWLVMDHYRPEWMKWCTKTAPIFRAVLKRLPPAVAMRATERLTKMLLPVHRAVAHKPVARMIWCRLSPLLTHYVTYPELNEQLQFEWALLDTHDSLTDFYKHWRTTAQIQRALKDLGAVDIYATYAGNGVEARCRRQVSQGSG